jgi:hypothetical protein
MTNPPSNDTPLDSESHQDPSPQRQGPDPVSQDPSRKNPSPQVPPSPGSQAPTTSTTPANPTPAASASPEPQSASVPGHAPAATPASPDHAPASPEPQSPQPQPTSPSLWHTLTKAAGYGEDLTPDQQIKRRTFVSFSAFALLGIAAWKSWFWIKDAVQSDGVQTPLRKTLNVDDKLFKHTLSPNHLAKTYPREQAAQDVRYNSGIGLGADPATWRLQVTKANGELLSISMDDLKALPKTDFAFEFKCIEGWSQVSWWGGVRFSDFVRHYNLTNEVQQEYVGLTTPDDTYYIGVDTPSMLHPQTILAYEMSGQPLPTRHGAPLRLIIPVKYGVKNLKCIGKIFFSNDRPRDYWFERGYDYYCGL